LSWNIAHGSSCHRGKISFQSEISHPYRIFDFIRNDKPPVTLSAAKSPHRDASVISTSLIALVTSTSVRREEKSLPQISDGTLPFTVFAIWGEISLVRATGIHSSD
jgi:hypothetical protein